MMLLEQGTDLKVDVNNDAKIRDIAIMTSPTITSFWFLTSFGHFIMTSPEPTPGNDGVEAWGSWDPVWNPS